MVQKFYVCSKCGNIVDVVKQGGGTLKCCGEDMTEIVPNSTSASAEKHTPVCSVNGNKVEVTVGSVEHPMAEDHYIQWIVLQTTSGSQSKELKPGQAPKACFNICDGDKVEAAFAYCNTHSLWKA